MQEDTQALVTPSCLICVEVWSAGQQFTHLHDESFRVAVVVGGCALHFWFLLEVLSVLQGIFCIAKQKGCSLI